MDFGFSDEQEQLRSVVADFLSAEAPVSYARAMMQDERGFEEKLWGAMARLGWLGLCVPERFGGSGLGSIESVILSEAMGRVCLPGPFFSTVCMGIPAVLACGSEEQAGTILSEVVVGTSRLTVAMAEAAGSWTGKDVAMSAERAGDGFVLTGQKLFVLDARSADRILTVAKLDEGLGVFEVAAGDVTIEPMATVDETRKLDVVTFESVRLDANALLGGGAVSAATLDAVMDVARLNLCAEMCGCADSALALSVEYAQMREQFGRPIATFQSIQHSCADMKVDIENAKSLAYYAAWATDESPSERELTVSMAKGYASRHLPVVVADSIQVHGGIGFTWEHDLHIFFKRCKGSEVLFGDATEHQERVAAALL